MTKTRDRIPYEYYDALGRKVKTAHILLSIPDESFTTEYHNVITNLKKHYEALTIYLKIANNNELTSLEQAYKTLKLFIFPQREISRPQKAVVRTQTITLFKAVNTLAGCAVKVRQGGFLGIGADEARYQLMNSWLKQVGEYAESTIIEMPWPVSVKKEYYLLTALKDSPEAFIKAQKDPYIDTFVNKLNAAKQKFPTEELQLNGSNLNTQVKQYLGQISSLESEFKQLKSKNVKEIIRIDTIRKSRWGITNFFVDLFTGQKSHLQQLESRNEVVSVLQQSYSRLVKEATEPLKMRSIFIQFNDKLLHDAASVSEENILDLQRAIKYLLQSKERQQANSYINTFKKVITENIRLLGRSNDFMVPLSKQFAFLTENDNVSINELDNVRQEVRQCIQQTLHTFDTPDKALQFIQNLESLNISSLDKIINFSAEISTLKADYIAWKMLEEKGLAFIAGDLPLESVYELRASAIRALKSPIEIIRREATSFNEKLQAQIKKNVDILKHGTSVYADPLIRVIQDHFIFYTSDSEDTEEAIFTKPKTMISEYIEHTLEADSDPKKALAYIASWEKLDIPVLKAFDIKLFQVIQNKKHQYISLELLHKNWDKLLINGAASQLSLEEVNHFIAAILWLDKPNIELNSPLIELFKNLNSRGINKLQQITKDKCACLSKTILNDFTHLGQGIFPTDQKLSLKYRLMFITPANAMYTKELAKTREEVILSICKHLKKQLSIKELKEYLDILRIVLPSDLAADPVLSAAIKEGKLKLVKDHFSQQQLNLQAKYQNELEFLRTGDLSLWEKITSTFSNIGRKALSEENIYRWRNSFLYEYADALIAQVDNAVQTAILKETDGDDLSTDAKILKESLEDLVSNDYETISKQLILDLHELADLRHQQARQKLDKLFGLQPTKPVDINMFILRYLAMTEYQLYYSQNETLVEAGRNFIREFQQMAQHEGGFTKLVARLPLNALRELDSTWQESPKVIFDKSETLGVHLNKDIVGEVNSNSDTHIQLPRYLLLNMVLELIAVDFDALLRGEKINTQLLNDKIEFVIPKLEQQVSYEARLNENSKDLREELILAIMNINPDKIKDCYTVIIASQMPGIAEFNKWGILSNLIPCEKRFLEHLKLVFKDKLDILSALKAPDFEIASEQNIVQTLDKKLQELKEQLNILSKQKDVESTKEIILISIESLQKKKVEQENMIEIKKTEIRLFQNQLNKVNKLLNNNKVTLKEFISELNERMFDLLDPNMAIACKSLQKNIALSTLLNDEQFINTKNKLLKDLEDPSVNILDILREFPESLTRELPSKKADMIRQLQYRFADRFKKLMVKMLDENNLRCVDEVAVKPLLTKDETKLPEKSFWGYLFSISRTPSVQSSNIKIKRTAQLRLQEVLQNINSNSFKRMLEQLAKEADTEKISLAHLYQMNGISPPIKIDPTVREVQQSKPLKIGSPSSSIYRSY